MHTDLLIILFLQKIMNTQFGKNIPVIMWYKYTILEHMKNLSECHCSGKHMNKIVFNWNGCHVF